VRENNTKVKVQKQLMHKTSYTFTEVWLRLINFQRCFKTFDGLNW